MTQEIKIRFGGDSRNKLNTRGIMPCHEDGEEWTDDALATLNRQKTNVVVETEDEAEALLKAVDRMRDRVPAGGIAGGEGTTWMTHAHQRAFNRVHSELVDACKERGWCGFEPEPDDITVVCGCDTEWTCKETESQIICPRCGPVEV